MHCVGFEPFFDSDSEILILGSFPSVKSRETDFYYGNKQNRFWRTLATIFNCAVPTTNEEKKLFLAKYKIALWDIVVECDIKGSMDADIKNPKLADIYRVLNAAPIKKIITNGQKAHSLFVKHFPELEKITVPLPSTSPANARFDFEKWKAVFNC